MAHKEVFSLDDAVGDGSPDTYANARLIIVLGLGGRVDSPETCFKRLVHKIGRLVLLPSGSIDEFGNCAFGC